MMMMTIIISSRVKPAVPRFLSLLTIASFFSYNLLPILVFRAIESNALRLGEDIENALAAPGIGFGIVLHGAHAPLRSAGHGINGNFAQKADFLALHIDAFHQSLKIRGIVLAVDLGLKATAIGRVFVAVDGIAHLPQGDTQLALLFALD